jgi:hypothetical protein
LGTSSNDSLQKQLIRAKKDLQETGKVLDRLIKVIEPTEQTLLRREFQSRTVLDPGQSKVVLCLEDELAESRSFRKALSKMDVKKPTLVKIPEDRTSRRTNLTVARMIPTEVLANSEGSVLVVNVQKELMLKQLENDKVVIIGSRYYHDSDDMVNQIEQTLKSQGVNVLSDKGLYGGGALTYELVRTMQKRPQSTVVELTLSKSVADNTNILRRILESLLSL